ncbi:methylenetetrahydrofolate reductase [NAD(P)H] [Ruminiclostridium herbifermentans]|uniref:Methylenetetrahydrofolate reductase n=1 Tax=Ruminiclostridium herbifermentans TaxID=2488810 RepID=A0A4U7JLV3_9FIRM|nr:methylenetetrahydrofolate reductase [NAD(P)H] [Ruminiclostridium herbifermentans]QNU68148.1 methylenetetrahydrofolate reductase [NAD(P)H] [Ruminiclostridium herbifermentans]
MIKDIYSSKKNVFSLEVFPPKKDDDFPVLFNALDEIKKLKLDFISITYGAGGSTSKRTLDIASYVQNKCNIEALAHLTCVSLDECSFCKYFGELKANQINNVLALRGDRPKDMTDEAFFNRPYKYALDLVNLIKQKSDTCIGGACYPEVHPESCNQEEDLYFLKSKVDAGIEFLLTQLFFDNTKFYNFYEQARNHGISVPISAGIMPITAPSQIHTIVELSGASIPEELKAIFTKYENNADDFKKAGIEYATKQISKLLEYGVQGIHLYTLNKADVSKAIFENLGLR